MRLLQLPTGSSNVIDLHPNISIVQGLDERERGLLVDTVRGIPAGRTAEEGGLIEAHGVLLDLTADVLALLDLRATDIDPVVLHDDLPGHDGDEVRVLADPPDDLDEQIVAATQRAQAAARLVRAAEEAVRRAQRAVADATGDTADRLGGLDQLTARLDELAERRRRLDEDIQAARPAAREATEARAAIEAAVAEAREARRATSARCGELAADLDQLRASSDPGATPAATGARAAIEALEAELDAARDRAAEDAAARTEAQERAQELSESRRQVRDEAARETDELRAQLAALDQQVLERHELLAVLVAGDIEPVVESMDRVRTLELGEPLPLPEALDLADRLDELDRELRAVGSPAGGDGRSLAAARQRLDAARDTLIDAERAVRVPELDREDIEALEAAHAELLEALEKSTTRFRAAKAQQRLDDARAAEAKALERLGFASYTDYLTGSSLHNVDEAKEARLDAARQELTHAEEAWNELQADTASELARARLLDQRRRLASDAVRLLRRSEPVERLAAALRDLRVPPVPPDGALDDLRDRLERAGVAIGDEPLDPEELLELAEAWLAEAERARHRHDDVTAELAQLEASRSALAAELTRRAADEAEAQPENASSSATEDRVAEAGDAALEVLGARLFDARQALDAAEARAAAQRKLEVQVDELNSELAEASSADNMAGEELARTEGQLQACALAEQRAVERLRQLEDELAVVVRDEEEATAELRALEVGRLDEARARLEAEVVAQQAEAESKRDAAASADAELARLESVRDQRERSALQAQQGDGGIAAERGDEAGLPVTADELEWYLLARLAGQRSVSYAGSVPLLLDGALAGIDATVVEQVLGRLERMAEAVQVIVVSDDPAVTSWALSAGPQRAALVRPGPPDLG